MCILYKRYKIDFRVDRSYGTECGKAAQWRIQMLRLQFVSAAPNSHHFYICKDNLIDFCTPRHDLDVIEKPKKTTLTSGIVFRFSMCIFVVGVYKLF